MHELLEVKTIYILAAQAKYELQFVQFAFGLTLVMEENSVGSLGSGGISIVFGLGKVYG